MDLLAHIDMPNVGIHFETYYMDMEERSIPEVIKREGFKLFYVHLSDHTRGYPHNKQLGCK